MATYTITFVVSDDLSPPNLLQGAEVDVGGEKKLTDINGEAQYVREAGSYPYSVSKEGYGSASGEVEVIDQNVNEPVTLGVPKTRATSVGTQVDIDQPPEDLPGRITSVAEQIDIDQPPEDLPGRITSVGTQVEFYDGAAYPPDPRVNAMFIQVEVGEYYITAKPIRTRPRPARARVLPVHPASRIGVEPPYGRA